MKRLPLLDSLFFDKQLSSLNYLFAFMFVLVTVAFAGRAAFTFDAAALTWLAAFET